jgi:protein-S-isoprenylcysteine O-methyltransferase Ste14
MLIPPPVLALGAGVAQRLLSGAPRPRSTARIATASVVAAASGALAVRAARSFRQVGTTLDPAEPSHASVLVTSGPHAVTRNPMYVGLTGVLVANAVRLGSWRSMVPVAAFVLVIDRVQIAAEETALRERFGNDYDAYAGRVPRWVDRRSLDALTAARPRPSRGSPASA